MKSIKLSIVVSRLLHGGRTYYNYEAKRNTVTIGL